MRAFCAQLTVYVIFILHANDITQIKDILHSSANMPYVAPSEHSDLILHILVNSELWQYQWNCITLMYGHAKSNVPTVKCNMKGAAMRC